MGIINVQYLQQEAFLTLSLPKFEYFPKFNGSTSECFHRTRLGRLTKRLPNLNWIRNFLGRIQFSEFLFDRAGPWGLSYQIILPRMPRPRMPQAQDAIVHRFILTKYLIWMFDKTITVIQMFSKFLIALVDLRNHSVSVYVFF